MTEPNRSISSAAKPGRDVLTARESRATGMTKVALATALLVVASRADADCLCRLFDDPDGEAWAHYELTDVARISAPGTRVDDEVLAGLRLGGVLGGAHVGYHAEIDLFAGSTIERGGFAYDVAFYPLGVGMRIGRTSVVALGTGIVAAGATRWIDDGVGVPLQATVELGAGRVRFLGRARVALLAGSRDPTAPSLPVGDLLEAMAGLRVGHHYEDWEFPTGNGYFVALAYKELLGARYVGLTVGYSIDAGTQRRRHRVE